MLIGIPEFNAIESELRSEGLSVLQQDSLVFLENDGIVIIEAESATIIPAEWTRDSTIVGFTGSSSLHYTGNDLFNIVGRSVLTYKIYINEIGRYRVRWRSRIAIGSSNSEHNDSWLRLPDASDFYAQQNQTRLYPKGSGRTPNPNGSGANGWFKAYQNNNGIWSLQTWTSDNDRHPIFAEFDSVGVYTIQIAGRSNGHSIDRLIMHHVTNASEADALNPDRPESTRIVVQTGIPQSIRMEQLKVFPNPAKERINISLPNTLKAGVHNLRIFNHVGREVKSASHSLRPGGRLSIATSDFPSGLYFIEFFDGQNQFVGRYIRD